MPGFALHFQTGMTMYAIWSHPWCSSRVSETHKVTKRVPRAGSCQLLPTVAATAPASEWLHSFLSQGLPSHSVLLWNVPSATPNGSMASASTAPCRDSDHITDICLLALDPAPGFPYIQYEKACTHHASRPLSSHSP